MFRSRLASVPADGWHGASVVTVLAGFGSPGRWIYDQAKVVRMPTTEGDTVPLSVEEMDAFVNDLRKIGQ